MRFRVERDALAEAVAWAARALPARPVVPVLSGLLLQAGDGLTLSCFDYEVSARIQIDADISERGTALVPGRLLAEITRSLPGRPVEFGSEADAVSLTCRSAAFTLVTLPIEEYPALPELPAAAGTVDGGALATAVAQVAPAASRDDTLPMLTGVYIEFDGEVMTLAATDRYRLAVRELRWNPARPGIRATALVPARTLADAARTMAAGTPVAIALRGTGEDPAGRDADGGAATGAGAPGEAMIGFEGGGRRMTTRLIAGEFIRYRSRFPDGFGCRAEVPADLFSEAVRRVSLVAERGSPVRLAFGAGKLVIEAGTEGQARAVETVTADFHGDEPVISFNPHYLLDGLAAAAVSAAPGPADAASGAPAASAGAAGSHGSSGTSGTAPAGETADEGRAAGAVSPGGPRRIRLEFTSPVKPAVLTGLPAAADAGDDADDIGGEGAAGGADEGAAPDFRYLVVPLRVPARQ